ncbi:hypothetical protein HOY80DRAFT_1081887, partial [Tuber brumale]
MIKFQGNKLDKTRLLKQKTRNPQPTTSQGRSKNDGLISARQRLGNRNGCEPELAHGMRSWVSVGWLVEIADASIREQHMSQDHFGTLPLVTLTVQRLRLRLMQIFRSLPVHFFNPTGSQSGKVVRHNHRQPEDFSLVDFDKLGNPLGLHQRLGELPLHRQENDWYSVLGSLNCATDNPETASELNEGNQENTLDVTFTPANRPSNARPSAKIFCQYHKCSGNSGPHTCALGRFTCEAPNCSWRGTFKTKEAFNRHYLAKHHNDRVDCPVKGCTHVGDRGIKRADNLPAHLLNKHGIARAGPPCGD